MVLSTLAAIVFSLAGSSSAAMPSPLMDTDANQPAYRCDRTFHIAPVSINGDGSAEKPWNSLRAADDSGHLRGGDCAVLADGTYSIMDTIGLMHGGGARTGPVVYRAATPRGAHLVAAVKVQRMIDIHTAWLVLDGLDVDGNHGLAEAEGIATDSDAGHHHLTVENCHIHDMGGGGIQLNDSDFFFILANETDHNAATSAWQESGISIYQVQDSHSDPDHKGPRIVIAGNISHDNVETFACATPGCHTDGNGIIVDKTLNVDRKIPVPYPYPILVANNVAYGNGGAGIQVYLSQHVTVVNNTAYDNHRDALNGGTWRGELSNVDSDATTWRGNIAYAIPGAGILSHNSAILFAATGQNTGNGPVAWTNNLTFGPVDNQLPHGPSGDANRLGVDPLFADAVHGDFHLGAGSPAIGANDGRNIGAY